jgi:hypothetical protein
MAETQNDLHREVAGEVTPLTSSTRKPAVFVAYQCVDKHVIVNKTEVEKAQKDARNGAGFVNISGCKMPIAGGLISGLALLCVEARGESKFLQINETTYSISGADRPQLEGTVVTIACQCKTQLISAYLYYVSGGRIEKKRGESTGGEAAHDVWWHAQKYI